MTIDRELVTNAIIACEVGGPAKEEAARLMEAYLDKLADFPDTAIPTLGTEVPWYIQLAPKIFVVGVVDRILDDSFQTMCEWKTKKAPKLRKDGLPYVGSTEEDWLHQIGTGVQLATYALAKRDGVFMFPGTNYGTRLGGDGIQVLVRAAVKSKPPVFWPTDPMKGLFKFEDAALNAVRSAFLVMGNAILGARKGENLPWQIIGDQCHKYGADCVHLPECSKFQFGPIPLGSETTDPGFAVCKMLGLDLEDPKTLVLSQSGYQTATRCLELYRRECSGGVPGEKPEQAYGYERDIGTAYHAGLAATYRQVAVK